MTDRQKDWMDRNFTLSNLITICALAVALISGWATVRNDTTSAKSDISSLQGQVNWLTKEVIELRTTSAGHSRQLDRIEDAVYKTQDAVSRTQTEVTDLPVIKIYRDRPRPRPAH